MKKFNSGKDWKESMIKEVILNWNLTDEKGNKLSIDLKGMDRIKSIKLRNWIIRTLNEVVIESLDLAKKK